MAVSRLKDIPNKVINILNVWIVRKINLIVNYQIFYMTF
jgi:hypothetical protein